jgi:membrane dipeptidase
MIQIFDGHCDTVMRCVYDPNAHIAGTGGQWDLDQVEPVAQVAQFFAFFWNSARVTEPAEVLLDRYYTAFRREMDTFSDRIVQCRTGEEIDAAFAAGKQAAILSVEGGELLDCSIPMLHKAYDMGVRAVNITWNHANALAGSHMDHPERGLSPQGVAFVQEMEKLGMLPDVSHLSEAGFWDVIETAKKPIIATHSNSQNTYFHSRNLTDDQFQAIIKNNGIVGLNGYTDFIGAGEVTAVTLMRHLEHFLSLGGEKVVALGGDWDGCDSLPQGWTGIWSWAEFYELLLRENYPESLVRDLFFNNLMRTVRQL